MIGEPVGTFRICPYFSTEAVPDYDEIGLSLPP